MGFQYEVKPPCWRKSLLVLDNFTEFPTLNCGSSSRSGSKTGLRLQRLLAQMCFLWAFYGGVDLSGIQSIYSSNWVFVMLHVVQFRVWHWACDFFKVSRLGWAGIAAQLGGSNAWRIFTWANKANKLSDLELGFFAGCSSRSRFEYTPWSRRLALKCSSLWQPIDS